MRRFTSGVPVIRIAIGLVVLLVLQKRYGHSAPLHYEDDDSSDDLVQTESTESRSWRRGRSAGNSSRQLFEGDMVMYKPTSKVQNDGVLHSALTDTARWPNAVVPYNWSSSYNREQQAALSRAMRDFHRYTCIHWIPRNQHRDYVHFAPEDTGCFSHIGRQGGEQIIGLNSGCFNDYGTIIHEMMHALGFVHEQSRYDRDDYIEILEENVEYAMRDNFKKYPTERIDLLNESYDYDSVMHYERTAFSRDGHSITIRAKRDGAERMGQRDGFSEKDIKKINKLYNCPRPTASPSSSTTPLPTTTILPKTVCNSAQVIRSSDTSVLALASPGYPKNYPSDLNCQDLINTTASHVIKITIVDFRTEEGNDFLKIYDGDSIRSPLIAKIDGESAYPDTFLTTQPYLTIKFTTDDSVEHRGWLLFISAVPAVECVTVHHKLSGGESITLNSPQYPNDYLNNLDCTIVISTAFYYRFHVTFEFVETEKNRDILEIYDGTETSHHSKIEVSGDSDNLPASLFTSTAVTKSNFITFKFTTDNSVTRRGWEIRVESVSWF